MNIKHSTISCPHCGHPMHLDLDFSQGDQDYYEDCSNCCSPIHLNTHINTIDKKLEVAVSSDDEQLY